MAHIDATNQNQTIQYLQAANARLRSGLKITRIAWSFRAIKETKTYSSLHVEVETPAMANRLITEGFFVDHEIKNCEKLVKSCKLTQCFNCYKYGHIAKRCRNPTACGLCAGGHSTNECNPETTGKHKWCACNEERGHVAWAPTCKLSRNKQDREGQEKLIPALRHGRPDRSAVIHLLGSNLNGQGMQRNTRAGNGETCQRFLEGRHQQEKENRPSGFPRSLLGRSQPRSGHVMEGHGDHETHEHAKSDGKANSWQTNKHTNRSNTRPVPHGSGPPPADS